MHARSRTLRLGGTSVPGPLLVPSVSSKGFGMSGHVSEAGLMVASVAQDLTEALLISAYDLAHDLLPDSQTFLGSAHRNTVFASPELLLVDSGGYELNRVEFEGGQTHRDERTPRLFSRDDFETLADRLPADRELLVVSYDEPVLLADPSSVRGSYSQQREAAQAFFAARPHLRSDFLIKPEGRSPYLNVRALTIEAENLRAFDVVGVTEKELGRTLLDRLVALAGLRDLLDRSGCEERPIHVFGCLDPVLTPLYFMAGGEIFDGLSWLRYAFLEDVSVHPDQYALLVGAIEEGEAARELRRLMSNVAHIRSMQRSLARWAAEPERYEHLGLRHTRLREVYDDMRARLTQEG
jgi:hypothetical protein